MSIPNFVAQVSNPFDDLTNISKIVASYSRGNLYNSIQHQNVESKVVGIYDTRQEDKFYADIFNVWKKNVVTMTQEEYLKLAARKKVDKDFIEMRKYLKTVGDVKTKKEVMDILYKNNSQELLDALEKYNPFDQSMSWSYCTNRYLDNRRSKGYGINHRLYLNVDSNKVHKLANEFIKKCGEMHLLYEFKFDAYANRADTFVVYCSDDNLLLFVKILELIKQENKDLEHAFHKPPLLTGAYKGWIGYGEEYDKAKSSYSDDRANYLSQVLDADFKEWKKTLVGKEVTVGKRKFSDLDYICYEMYKERLASQRKTYENRQKYNSKGPKGNINLLSDRTYQNKLYALIKNYVYSNKSSIFYGGEFNPKILKTPNIFGDEDMIFGSSCDRYLRNLYSNSVKNNKTRLTRLQTEFKKKLKENELSSRVVLSQERLGEYQKYQNAQKNAHRVVASRKADNKKTYSNILFVFDKIASTITINHDNSLMAVQQLLKPLFDKYMSLKNTLDKVAISRISGSSENYDERMQYYIHNMYLALHRLNVPSYEYYLNICLSYEQMESKGISK